MVWPFDNFTAKADLPWVIASTLVSVKTVMPLACTHSLIRPPAFSVIMRGTIRLPISTTVSSTPLLAKASRMMQPIKPAPICKTRAPGLANLSIARASSKVQQWCTPGKSIPGMGGCTGTEPVAISNLSKLIFCCFLLPSSTCSDLFLASSESTRPCSCWIFNCSKCLAVFRKYVPASSILPTNK